MNTPALLLKPRGAALRTHGTQRTLLSAIQRTTHKQIMEAYVDNPIQRAIFISQTAKNTGAHLQQPDSEARLSGRALGDCYSDRQLCAMENASQLIWLLGQRATQRAIGQSVGSSIPEPVVQQVQASSGNCGYAALCG